MNQHPTRTPRQTDFIALVERMKQRGLAKVVTLPAPARVEKLPATQAIQQPKARREPTCRWCGSLQPASAQGHCKRCGKPVRGALGVRSRDFIATANGNRGVAKNSRPTL